jgi:hypothetical protein
MPNVASVLKTDLVYSDGLGRFGSRIFFQYSGVAPNDSVCDGFASHVATSWVAHLASITSSNIALVEVDVTDLTSPSNGQGSWNGSDAGSESPTEQLPNNVSFDVQFKIPVRYRGGHPVIHLPGQLASQLQTSRTWESSFITTAVSAFEGFIASASAPGGILDPLVHVVVRGYRNPSPGIHVEPVTGYAGRETVGTTRKRARALR